MGLGGAATAVTKESKVPLYLGKRERSVKALVYDQVPLADVHLVAEWFYEHTVTTTHRPPAIWFEGNKRTMIHSIVRLDCCWKCVVNDSFYVRIHGVVTSPPYPVT